jgi:hypothetical protein
MVKAIASSLLTSIYAVYKAESNANDSIGSNNGTAQGGLTYASGISGNAFVFNGTNAYVSLPNNCLNFSSNNFSVNIWVYIINTGYQVIIDNYYYPGSGNQYGWWLNQTGSNIIFSYINSSQAQIDTSISYSGKYSGWHMLTVTKVLGGRTKFYLDNSLITTNANTTNPVYTTTHLPCIGVEHQNATSWAGYMGNGSKIDEVGLWTKELTSTEVSNLYNSGAGKFYPTF